MDEDPAPDALDRDAPGLAALADPLRRRLFRYVARSPRPVGREEAADAVGVPRHTAKFHLDRMVDEGLLEVEFKRLSGRSGPGAGRPAKVYRRSDREFALSVPERHYDLLGRVLAAAAAASVEQRVPVDEVAGAVAQRHGQEFARAHDRDDDAPLEQVAGVLEQAGYEPRVAEGRVLLENCPFDRVAQEHTALVCGLNLDFVHGVIDGLGCEGVCASLDPSPGRCCVSARLEGTDPAAR